MSILSDRDIEREYVKKTLVIEPFIGPRVQPASYDVSLGSRFLIFDRRDIHVIDPRLAQVITREHNVPEGGDFILHPGEFVLAATNEWFEIPSSLAARIEGKSSLGRLGLVVHSTAGWIDPGFNGNITLELSSEVGVPILLRPGMLIAQIAFMRLSTTAERPYGHPSRESRYHGDRGPTASQSWRDAPMSELGYPVSPELRERCDTDGS